LSEEDKAEDWSLAYSYGKKLSRRQKGQKTLMKLYLLIVLTLAAIWDGFATVYGTLQVLGDGLPQIVASFLFSALIMGFVLNTARIMRWARSGEFVALITTFFWFIALGYDFYTSWLGNADFIIQNSGDSTETVILVGLTALVVASPILLSLMWERRASTGNQRVALP